MGLFDSLKKNLGDLSKELEKHKDDIQKGLGQFTAQQSSGAAQRAEDRIQPEPVDYPAPVKKEVVDQFPKFDDIISRNFAGCDVRRNVAASELMSDCHPACTPVQFMFYEGGRPVLAVVLVKTNNYRGMNVLGTKKICDAKNIPYIRFYQEYENDEAYVVERIKKYL